MRDREVKSVVTHLKDALLSLSLKDWLIVVLAGALISLTGCDGQAAENTAKAEQAAHEKKLELLSTPIGYTATVTQCDTENGCRTRFYSPRSERHAAK
jgi:hypothetical protein